MMYKITLPQFLLNHRLLGKYNSIAALKLILILLVSFYLTGCKKSKESKEILYDQVIVEKFFSNSTNLPNVEQRIVALLKEKEKEFHFVENFVKYQGFPLWKKATINLEQFQQSSTNFANNNTATNIATILKIPLQLQGFQSIHGYLLVMVTPDSIGAAIIDGRSYEQCGFLSNPTQDIVAENLATEIMYFNHSIYGSNNFNIIDNRLFGVSINNNVKKIARFDTSSNNNSNSINNVGGCGGVSSTVFITTTTTSNHCPYPPNACPNIYAGGALGPCDNCPLSCSHSTSNTEIHSFCTPNSPNNPGILVWTLEQPQDPQGSGAAPPGWIPTPTDPCLTTNTANTSTTICGLGWTQPYVCNYQLSTRDQEVIDQINAEDVTSNSINQNNCKGTKRTGNVNFQGTKEHWLIELDYVSKNPVNGEIEYSIPGASLANPANRGYADMADTYYGKILEIKPNNPQGQQAGATEVANYVLKANLNCSPPLQIGTPWAAGNSYTTTTIPFGTNKFLKAELIAPGVVGYSYTTTPNPSPIFVPIPELDKLKALIERLRNNLADANRIIAEYMNEHP